MTRTSRYLSLILRHRPQDAGVTLDQHGWSNIDVLIMGVSKMCPLTRKLLEEIVHIDDKQRYSFSEDGTLIWANQCHSIPVDVELEEMTPPEYLWHGTGEKFVESIEINGLLAKSRLYVHLSPNYETASRHGRPVAFRINAGMMSADGYLFCQSVNHVWLTKCVPAYYLTREDKSCDMQRSAD